MGDFYSDSRTSPTFPSSGHITCAAFCCDSYDNETGWVKVSDVKKQLYNMVAEDKNGSKRWASKEINDGMELALKHCILFEYDKRRGRMRIVREDD